MHILHTLRQAGVVYLPKHRTARISRCLVNTNSAKSSQYANISTCQGIIDGVLHGAPRMLFEVGLLDADRRAEHNLVGPFQRASGFAKTTVADDW